MMTDDIRSIVRDERISKGLPVEKLAEKAGVGECLYYRFTKGKTVRVDMDGLIAMLEVLGLELTVRRPE
ncbi:MAG: hypothetical protein Q4P22_08470 [Eubacteriales bacterium]|nr:hypothetical protein [Eubacteriales bacterium]